MTLSNACPLQLLGCSLACFLALAFGPGFIAITGFCSQSATSVAGIVLLDNVQESSAIPLTEIRVFEFKQTCNESMKPKVSVHNFSA